MTGAVSDDIRQRLAEPAKLALERAEELAQQGGDSSIIASHLFLAILPKYPGPVAEQRLPRLGRRTGRPGRPKRLAGT